MTYCKYCGKLVHLFGKYGWTDEDSVHYECYKKRIREIEKKNYMNEKINQKFLYKELDSQ